MAVMIKLKLPPAATFDVARDLPGLSGLALDERFGLVAIDPRRSLYVVRTAAGAEVGDIRRRQQLSPEIEGAYGDVRIGPA